MLPISDGPSPFTAADDYSVKQLSVFRIIFISEMSQVDS